MSPDFGSALRAPEVLHYVGADDDRGGIVSVVRALAEAGRFGCILGVNTGFRAQRPPPRLATKEFSPLAGEVLGPGTFWRARTVAREVRAWLAGDPRRVFHGHSRAGLAVALWLARAGERRVVVSVHCYGKQRWFYRYAARQLGGRLYWLTPAMRLYYGAAGEGWAQCIPGCIPAGIVATGTAPRAGGAPLVLAGVGALVRWKRWDVVLAALAALPAAHRARWRFVHIGAADTNAASQAYAARLREQTRALGLGSCVEWRGPQPSSQALLAEADCLVVASEREPFSVAMLEALAARVPVLAADTGGARDVIAINENGWRFRTGDATDLAILLQRLSDGEALAEIRSRISPAHVQPFTAPVVAAQWAEVYARL